jgi:hypothetical protein
MEFENIKKTIVLTEVEKEHAETNNYEIPNQVGFFSISLFGILSRLLREYMSGGVILSSLF